MAIKVFINNFEIIEKAQIVIDGLVALVGESNNGKTATYNSIKVITYNVQGRGYIRKVNGKEVSGGARMGIMFEEENTSIIFEKNDSPIYRLQTPAGTLMLDKAGRGPAPEDVSKVLNMSPLDLDGLSINLNFVDQLSEPLLRKLSDYQMYKIAVKSFDGEKIQEAIASCKKDLEDKKTELKLKTNEIDVQKKSRLGIIGQIEIFNPLIDIRDKFNQYDYDFRTFPVLSGYNNRRLVIVNEVNVISGKLQALTPLADINAGYHNMLLDIEKARVLERYSNTRNNLYNELQVLDNYVVSYSPLTEIVSCYPGYIDSIRFLKYLTDKHNNRSYIEIELESINKELSFYGPDLVEINRSVSQYRKNVETLTTVSYLNEKRVSLIKSINTTEDELSKYAVIHGTTSYKNDVNAIRLLEHYAIRRSGLTESIIDLTNQVTEIDNEVTDLQYMIDNNICYACGQQVENCEHNEQ